MRKLTILAAVLAAALATAAVAVAAQVNQYEVTASTSPAKAGSKKHPLPVKLSFAFTVGEQSGQRPATIERYKIGFYGMRSNGQAFATCTAAKINARGSDRSCPKAAKVGTGSVANHAGVSSNPADVSIPCNLGLTIYNAGRGRAALYLHGNPPSCAVSISQALDGRFVKIHGGEALQFAVPQSLLHPLTGVDNAVVQVKSTIAKKTARYHGKKVGFFESVGCRGRKRPVTVTFTPESGAPVTARTAARCRK